MLKRAFEEGYAAALQKFGGLTSALIGGALRRPNAALALAGAGAGFLTAPEGEGLQRAAIGAGLGYGAGRLGAGKLIQQGLVRKNNPWLGQGVRDYAYKAMMNHKNLPA